MNQEVLVALMKLQSYVTSNDGIDEDVALAISKKIERIKRKLVDLDNEN